VDALLALEQTAARGMLDIVTGDVERLSSKKPASFAEFLAARKEKIAA